MKAIFVTSDNCDPCTAMKERLADLIGRGEIIEKNLEREPDEVAVLMEKYDANLPSLLILADDGELILSI